VAAGRRRSDWSEQVGERIAEAIEAKFRQVDFAKKVGITQGALSLWISGSVPEAWLRLKKVCEIAGVSADEVLGLKPAAGAPKKAAAKGETEDDAGLIRRRILGMLSKLEKGDLRKEDREKLEDLERRVALLEEKRAAG
jgi:transcriptional regulator with XRE-family HTH domain